MTFADAPLLSHPQAVVEPLSQAHCADLRAAVGNLWQLWYTIIPHPDAMATEIADRLEQQAAGLMAPWAIIDPVTGRAVGMTTYLHLDEQHRRLEIGSTWLSTDVQGTLINPATKLLLLQRAFEELDCIAVELRTHSHNHHSRRAIAKLGAHQDGILRHHMIMPNGTLRDTVVFSVLQSEWPTVKAGLEYRLAAPAAPNAPIRGGTSSDPAGTSSR